jgi:uncharacterized protein GlcG (DUF336 family)
MKTAPAAALALLLSTVTALHAQLADRKTLTLDAVKKIAAAAEAEARKNNWNVVIAILDDGGHLLYLQRMDNVQVASVDVAIGKARSAVLFRRPTKAFEDQLTGGRQSVLKLPGAMPFEGGVPITAGEQVIGGIGVSGVQSSQDGQIAKAGIAAIAQQ